MKTIIATIVLAIIPNLQAYADSITIGIENLDYFPYYSTADGGNKGAAIDLLNKFSETTDHTIKYKSLPVARLLPTFLAKDIAFKFPANPNWGENNKNGAELSYSEPVFQFTDGVLVKTENVGKGVKKLGVVRGFTAWDYLDKIESGEVKVKEGSNLESMVKMLDLGRIDGLYCNIVVANYIVKKVLGNNDSIIFDESQPHTTSNYHLASHGGTKVIEELNAFLIKESAYIKQLKDKYGIF